MSLKENQKYKLRSSEEAECNDGRTSEVSDKTKDLKHKEKQKRDENISENVQILCIDS